jgi:hypothetical protein
MSISWALDVILVIIVTGCWPGSCGECWILRLVGAVVRVVVPFAGLLAGFDPLLPLVVGDEGDGDQNENGEAEEEFHGCG